MPTTIISLARKLPLIPNLIPLKIQKLLGEKMTIFPTSLNLITTLSKQQQQQQHREGKQNKMTHVAMVTVRSMSSGSSTTSLTSAYVCPCVEATRCLASCMSRALFNEIVAADRPCCIASSLAGAPCRHGMSWSMRSWVESYGTARSYGEA